MSVAFASPARVLFAVAVFCGTAGALPSAVAQDTEPAAPEAVQAVLAQEQKVMQAIRAKDAKALRALLSEDFVLRQPGKPDTDRIAFLQSVASLPVEIKSLSGDELGVRVYGDMAIVTGVQRAVTREAGGADLESAGAFADVFLRRDGRWLLTLAFAVDLPPPQ